MTLSLHSKKSVSLLWIKVALFGIFIFLNPVNAQHKAVYHDNLNRFFIFDHGKSLEAEYLPVNKFSVGGKYILYTDNRNRLKMYYNGQTSILEVNTPTNFEALDDLAVYSFGGIIRIIDHGKTITVSTNSVRYYAEDSLVTFYDVSKSLLAVYYKGRIHMLEDGLAGKPDNEFRAGDNLVAYISSRTRDFKVFYQGQIRVIEPFLSGGTFKAGRDIVAYINNSEQKFRIYYKGEIFTVEEFPPVSFNSGDGIAAYVDNSGSFRIFSEGEVQTIASFEPDFYHVENGMVIYGEQGYFKVWHNNRVYTLETYMPDDWKAQWNTIVYRDLNRNVKVFSNGDQKVLTYDIVQDMQLFRDVIVVNKGMNNNNVYWNGKKY